MQSDAMVEQNLPNLGISLIWMNLAMLDEIWEFISSILVSLCSLLRNKFIILSFQYVNIPLQCSCRHPKESRQLQTCRGVSPDLFGSTKWPKMSMFSYQCRLYTILVPKPEPVPPPRLLITLIAIAQSIVSSSLLTLYNVKSQMVLFSVIYLSMVTADGSI